MKYTDLNLFLLKPSVIETQNRQASCMAGDLIINSDDIQDKIQE